MALVRVYLITYRRPRLLERAIASLVAQSCTDWICELHNDDPDDSEPERIASAFADSRIEYVRHVRNLGGTGSFNTFHRTVPEPYFAMLEDDNWWAPDFLARMVAAIEANPDATLAWANLRLWREEPDGSWTDTGRTTWQVETGASPRRFLFPQLVQVSDALHSNGAMLVRTAGAERHRVPESTPLASVEFVRERTYGTPLVLVPDVLGAFAMTRTSYRGDRRLEWEQAQFLLARSFLDVVPLSPPAAARLWALRRNGSRATTTLILIALSRWRHLPMLRYSRAGDWIAFARTLLHRPALVFGTLRARHQHEELWRFLQAQTAARWAEAQARGAVKLDVGSVERRGELPVNEG